MKNRENIKENNLQYPQITKVIQILKGWGGKLIEIPYTKSPLASRVHKKVKDNFLSESLSEAETKSIITCTFQTGWYRRIWLGFS